MNADLLAYRTAQLAARCRSFEQFEAVMRAKGHDVSPDLKPVVNKLLGLSHRTDPEGIEL
jgi:hypothetical protein